MNKDKVWNKIVKAVSLAIVFAMVLSFVSPINAEAKTTKVSPVASEVQFYTTSADPVATTVSTGSYKVVINRTKKKGGSSYCDGYLKFVAPETRTYTLNFSKVKGNKGGVVVGSVWLQIPDKTSTSGFLDSLEASTQGGTDSYIRLATKTTKPKNTKKVGYYLNSRKATISLNAGDVVYLSYGFIANKKTSNVTSKLVIK